MSEIPSIVTYVVCRFPIKLMFTNITYNILEMLVVSVISKWFVTHNRTNFTEINHTYLLRLIFLQPSVKLILVQCVLSYLTRGFFFSICVDYTNTSGSIFCEWDFIIALKFVYYTNFSTSYYLSFSCNNVYSWRGYRCYRCIDVCLQYWTRYQTYYSFSNTYEGDSISTCQSSFAPLQNTGSHRL